MYSSNPKPGMRIVSAQLGAVISLAYILGSSLMTTAAVSASPENAIPSFLAEASISVEVYPTEGDPAPQIKKGGTVLFAYSNGWWQIRYRRQWVETSIVAARQPAVTILDCKKIPDGVRWFAMAEQQHPGDKALPLALTKSIAFPPPEQTDLFLTWLSLCPYPEIPVIDTTVMWMFEASKLIKHPATRGNYVVKYLDPEQAFLARLDVMNTNGVIFLSDGSQSQMGPPFDHGFTELRYEVLAITNCNGLSFPMETLLSRYEPRTSANAPDDVYAAVVARLLILRVDTLSHDMATNFPTPTLIAQDYRFVGVTNGVAVNYKVINDQWNTVRNSNLVRAAKAYAAVSAKTVGSRMNRPKAALVKTVVLFLFFVPSAAYAALVVSRAVKQINKKRKGSDI
jgi:hypothetical protein